SRSRFQSRRSESPFHILRSGQPWPPRPQSVGNPPAGRDGPRSPPLYTLFPANTGGESPSSSTRHSNRRPVQSSFVFSPSSHYTPLACTPFFLLFIYPKAFRKAVITSS